MTLLDLFLPADQRESVNGDLLEEYAAIQATRGKMPARWWYCRQAVKTAAHFFVRQLSLGVVAVSVISWTLVMCEAKLVNLAAIAVLKTFPVYEYINAYLFGMIYILGIESIAIPSALGWFAARFTKGREMAVAITCMLPLLLLFRTRVTGSYRPPIELWLEILLPPVTMATSAVLRAIWTRRRTQFT